MLDLLVVGAGPTGIAIGAEARREGWTSWSSTAAR